MSDNTYVITSSSQPTQNNEEKQESGIGHIIISLAFALITLYFLSQTYITYTKKQLIFSSTSAFLALFTLLIAFLFGFKVIRL